MSSPVSCSHFEKDNSKYQCVYCPQIVIGMKNLLLHQISSHKDKVFVCTMCKPNLVFYESRHFFFQHILLYHPRNGSGNIMGKSQQNVQITNHSKEVYHSNTLDVSKLKDIDNLLQKALKVNSVKSKNFVNKAQAISKMPPNIPEQPVSINNVTENSDDSTSQNTSLAYDEVIIQDSEEGSDKVNKFSFVDRPSKEAVAQNYSARDSDVKVINKCELEHIIIQQNKKSGKNKFLIAPKGFKIVNNEMQSNISKALESVEKKPKNKVVHKVVNTARGKQIVLRERFIIPAKRLQRWKKYLRISEQKQKLSSTCHKQITRESKFVERHEVFHMRDLLGFTCDICASVYNTKWNLKEHVMQCHDENRKIENRCSIYGKRATGQKALRKHEVQHNKTEFICEVCGSLFKYKNSLYNHVQQHHDNSSFSCKVCSKEFQTKAGLTAHRDVHSERSYLCDICGKKIKYRDNLRKHMFSHLCPEKVKRFLCERCGVTFHSRKSLEEHTNVHRNKRPFKCSFCSKEFTNSSLLRQHSLVHTNIKKFKCEDCGISFKRSGHLNLHLKTLAHLRNLKNHTCKICCNTFESAESLYSHLLVHNTRKKCMPSTCSVCHKVLSNKASLRMHMMKHTGLKPFMCDICGMSFRAKVSLDVHIRRHTGEMPFSCSYCSARFIMKPYLVAHESLHTGEKLFICNICDKKFRSTNALWLHKSTTHRGRQYTCNLCSKNFNRRDNLAAHMHIHSNVRAFSCQVCPLKFIRSIDCKKHEKTHSISYKTVLEESVIY